MTNDNLYYWPLYACILRLCHMADDNPTEVLHVAHDDAFMEKIVREVILPDTGLVWC